MSIPKGGTCVRCGWKLVKIAHNWYCSNSACFYNTNRHRGNGKGSPYKNYV